MVATFNTKQIKAEPNFVSPYNIIIFLQNKDVIIILIQNKIFFNFAGLCNKGFRY